MGEKVLLDYHIHSDVSADCAVPMKEMAAAAQKKGLAEICFTEHIDIDFPDDLDFAVNFNEYDRKYAEAKDAFPGLRIRKGVEIGLDINTKEKAAFTVEGLELDFVIGSVHTVFGVDPYTQGFWEKHSKAEAFVEYLRNCVRCAKECDFFDVFGHIGYVSKSCPFEDKTLRYSEYSDYLDEILKTLIAKGKGIEVNTSGLAAGDSTLPETPIVKRYFEMGGEIITVGSDAHKAQAVGRAIEETFEALKNIGFKYVCAFEKRSPKFIALL